MDPIRNRNRNARPNGGGADRPITEISPPIIRDHVLGYLGDRSLISLLRATDTTTARHIRNQLNQEVRNRQLERKAKEVRGFREVVVVLTMMGLIQPRDLRGAYAPLKPRYQMTPLQQLVQRVPALPFSEREEALTALRRAVDNLNALPGSVNLPNFKNLCNDLADLEKILTGHPPYELCNVAANGRNVQTIVREHGITSTLGVRILEMQAIFPGLIRDLLTGLDTVDGNTRLGASGSAVFRGANVANTAQEFGITNHESIVELEYLALKSDHENSAMGHLVRTGQQWRTIAARYGIVTPEGLAYFEHLVRDAGAQQPPA
jgi:hypothetical protein